MPETDSVSLEPHIDAMGAKGATEGFYYTSRTASSHRRFSLLVFGALITIFLVLLPIGIHVQDWSTAAPLLSAVSTPQEISLTSPCGTSTEQAVSLGCVFDVPTFAWIPPRCYDEELVSSFLAFHDWEWYLDKPPTKRVSLDDVCRGEYDHVYVSWS